MTDYLEKRIVESKQTDTPKYGMTVDGYTKRSGSPTSTMIKLEEEKIWRRLMYWCFSNSGTHFVKIKGKCLVVHD